ncbi:MAG: flavodoxin [Clostridiales bacterium]|nr:flavodoxin [Clostridiales bacterium]
MDWTDSDSRVSYEYANEDERNVELVQTSVDDWDTYNTVFIGYPIWWGIASWVVNGFVESNDFTGKTVIPFCTSSSSGIGESGELLAQAAESGNWLDGERFSSSATQSDVTEWVEGLEL